MSCHFILFAYVSNEGSTADVAVSSEAEGDLPGELAVAGINTIDDAAARALLAASWAKKENKEYDVIDIVL